MGSCSNLEFRTTANPPKAWATTVQVTESSSMSLMYKNLGKVAAVSRTSSAKAWGRGVFSRSVMGKRGGRLLLKKSSKPQAEKKREKPLKLMKRRCQAEEEVGISKEARKEAARRIDKMMPYAFVLLMRLVWSLLYDAKGFS